MQKSTIICLTAMAVFFLGGTARAATLTVTNTDDGGAGSLRQAITDANADTAADTIVFASPLFDTAQTINLTSGLPTITQSVAITGRGARLLTVRRAAGAATISRIFYVLSANDGNNNGVVITVVISGMTISGGNIGVENVSYNGGTLTLDGVTVSGNSTGIIGGSTVISRITTTIINSTVSGNSNTQANGNIAAGIIVRGDGNFSNVVNIANSTVSNNTVSNAQGFGYVGINNLNFGVLNLNNVTITDNRTTVNGASSAGSVGGVRNASGSVVNTRNTIISGNTALGSTMPDVQGAFVSNGNNLIGNTSGGTGFGASGDKLNVTANLAALADNGGQTDTHALNAGSPAIDAGNNCVVNLSCGTNNPPVALTTDQRGNYVRQRGTAVDIGAFEYLAPTAAGVSIGGRALTAKGQGITGIVVTLTDGRGRSRSVISSTFGYFHFADVPAGETVILTAKGKRFTFSQPTQVLSLTADAAGVNFIAY